MDLPPAVASTRSPGQGLMICVVPEKPPETVNKQGIAHNELESPSGTIAQGLLEEYAGVVTLLTNYDRDFDRPGRVT